MKYIYKEPKGRELHDVDPEREKVRVSSMEELVKNSTTLVEFRIGRHLGGPFQGLYTLERKYGAKWIPLKDGDLLAQVLDDVSLEVTRSVESHGQIRK